MACYVRNFERVRKPSHPREHSGKSLIKLVVGLIDVFASEKKSSQIVLLCSLRNEGVTTFRGKVENPLLKIYATELFYLKDCRRP